jgi:hypothetical protein
VSNDAKEKRKFRTHLRDLSAAVTGFLNVMDEVMRKPESRERGQWIASAINDLEMANDRARYFALGVDYRKDRKGATYRKEETRAS